MSMIRVEKITGKPIALQTGEVVRAEVIDVYPSGGVTLEIAGAFITARSEVSIEKGDRVFFKVLSLSDSGEGRELKLKFLGDSATEAPPSGAGSSINVKA